MEPTDRPNFRPPSPRPRSHTSDPHTTLVVPALIADLGDDASLALCRILHRQYPQPEHAPGICPGVQSVFRLVRKSRPDARRDPAA